MTEKEGDPISLLMKKIGPRLLLCSPSGGVYRQEKMDGMIAPMSAADGKLPHALLLFYLDALINLFLARSEETGKEEKIMFRTARPGNESCKTDKPM